MIVSGIEQVAEGLDQDVFDFGRNSRWRAGFVAALGVGHSGADVAWGVVSVGGHCHEEVWAKPLREELVLHK